MGNTASRLAITVALQQATTFVENGFVAISLSDLSTADGTTAAGIMIVQQPRANQLLPNQAPASQAQGNQAQGNHTQGNQAQGDQVQANRAQAIQAQANQAQSNQTQSSQQRNTAIAINQTTNNQTPTAASADGVASPALISRPVQDAQPEERRVVCLPSIPDELSVIIAKDVDPKTYFQARSAIALGSWGAHSLLSNEVAWEMMKMHVTHGSNSYRPQMQGPMTLEELEPREKVFRKHLLESKAPSHLVDWHLDEPHLRRGRKYIDSNSMLRGQFFVTHFRSSLMVYCLANTKRCYSIRIKEDMCSYCVTEKLISFTTRTTLYTAKLEDLHSISTPGDTDSGFPEEQVRDVQLHRMSARPLAVEAKTALAGMQGAEYKIAFLTVEGVAIFDGEEQDMGKSKAEECQVENSEDGSSPVEKKRDEKDQEKKVQKSQLKYHKIDGWPSGVYVDPSELANVQRGRIPSTKDFWILFGQNAPTAATRFSWSFQVLETKTVTWPAGIEFRGIKKIAHTGRKNCFQINLLVSFTPETGLKKTIKWKTTKAIRAQEWYGKMYHLNRSIYPDGQDQTKPYVPTMLCRDGTRHRLDPTNPPQGRKQFAEDVWVNDTFLIYKTSYDAFCLFAFDVIEDSSIEE